MSCLPSHSSSLLMTVIIIPYMSLPAFRASSPLLLVLAMTIIIIPYYELLAFLPASSAGCYYIILYSESVSCSPTCPLVLPSWLSLYYSMSCLASSTHPSAGHDYYYNTIAWAALASICPSVARLWSDKDVYKYIKEDATSRGYSQ
jgi:hypothetical protein